MTDVVLIAVIIAFFCAAAGLVAALNRLVAGSGPDGEEAEEK
jgi:hypothetical protein